MTLVLRAAVTDQPISLAEHEDLVSHQSAGAVVGFVGMIRDHDGGREVVRLEYSAHPSAAAGVRRGGRRGRRAGQRGASRRGQPPDRRPADRGSRSGGRRRGRPSTGGVRHLRALVDTIKERLPVWKHQFFDDGTEEWVGSA